MMRKVSIAQENMDKEHLVKLSMEEMRILYEGVLQAFEQLEELGNLVEVVSIKPLHVDLAYSWVEITIILLSGCRQGEKLRTSFGVAPTSPEEVQERIVTRVKHRIQDYCEDLQKSLDSLESKLTAAKTCRNL